MLFGEDLNDSSPQLRNFIIFNDPVKEKSRKHRDKKIMANNNIVSTLSKSNSIFLLTNFNFSACKCLECGLVHRFVVWVPHLSTLIIRIEKNRELFANDLNYIHRHYKA